MKQLALYEATNIVRTDIVCNQPMMHNWHRTIFVIQFDDGRQLCIEADSNSDGRERCSINLMPAII